MFDEKRSPSGQAPGGRLTPAEHRSADHAPADSSPGSNITTLALRPGTFTGTGTATPRDNQLAPLESLQAGRRGSITDPFLHAASPTGQDRYRRPPNIRADRPDADRPLFHPMTDVSDRNLQVLTKTEGETNGAMVTRRAAAAGQPARVSPSTANNADLDPGRLHTKQQHVDPALHARGSPGNADLQHHQQQQPSLGTKRKMSSDAVGFAPVGSEIDPQLVGPASPSLDPDAPSPKRRGSAAGMPLTPYDVGNHPAGLLPTGFATDQPHGRLPPAIPSFAWTTPNGPSPGLSPIPPTVMHSEGTPNPPPGPHRPFDPSQPAPGMVMPCPPDTQMPPPEPSSSTTGTRVLRSRSRPSVHTGEHQADPDPPELSAQDLPADSPSTTAEDAGGSASPGAKKSANTPYSRSPELRVSHKLAERKRRKEMKDLFDELRDHLPADRGMKASKWEILSKAIDYVAHMKQIQAEMTRENEMLRIENDHLKHQGVHPPPPFVAGPSGPHPGVIYGTAPMGVPYPPPPGVITAVPTHPTHPAPQPNSHHSAPHTPQPLSRPGSAPVAYPPAGGPASGPPNGAPTTMVPGETATPPS